LDIRSLTIAHQIYVNIILHIHIRNIVLAVQRLFRKPDRNAFSKHVSWVICFWNNNTFLYTFIHCIHTTDYYGHIGQHTWAKLEKTAILSVYLYVCNAERLFSRRIARFVEREFVGAYTNILVIIVECRHYSRRSVQNTQLPQLQG
jgi:hypothetical protein